MKVIPLEEKWMKQLTDLWNKELGNDFPMREALLRQNSSVDENVLHEGSWIAVNDLGKPIGFVVSKIWQEDLGELVLGKQLGWIQVLLVDSHYRNQGIGSDLLNRAENALKAAGAITISLGKDPWHYFPGIPTPYEDVIAWFEKRGYSYVETVHDLFSADEKSFSNTLPRFEGVQFRLLAPEDEEKFLAFFDRCFPGRWKYEAIHYFKRNGKGREFVVVEKDDEIIGFCRINDPDSPFIAQNVYWAPLFEKEMGGIGPLGIDQRYRKHGYGLAVVQAGTYFLSQRGISTIVIDWTGLVDFYRKLGFEIWKSYSVHTKYPKKDDTPTLTNGG